MVPQPVKAVILLFPLTDDFKKKREARYAKKQVKEGHIDPTIIWIKQTVRPGFTLLLSPHNTRINSETPDRLFLFCLNRLGMHAELWRCCML